MGFGKDFTKALVKQVGRDTGKVISNSMYGDAHSIPIRRVGNELHTELGEPIPYEDAVIYLEDEGFKPNLKLMHILLVPIVFILTAPIVYISPIVYIWKGISKLLKKSTAYEKPTVEPTYVQDRRYKSGVRQSGYINTKIKVVMPANDREKSKYKIRGIIYLLLGLILVALNVYLMAKVDK